jgi:hypothetical protein
MNKREREKALQDALADSMWGMKYAELDPWIKRRIRFAIDEGWRPTNAELWPDLVAP